MSFIRSSEIVDAKRGRKTVDSIESYRKEILETINKLGEVTSLQVGWELRKSHIFSSAEVATYLRELCVGGELRVNEETGKYSVKKDAC